MANFYHLATRSQDLVGVFNRKCADEAVGGDAAGARKTKKTGKSRADRDRPRLILVAQVRGIQVDTQLNATQQTEATDNELLMQFVRDRDAEAFRQLVDKYQSLVMGVCRQVSRNEQDAEDSFQATFLILARRAHRLLNSTSLGGWLHTVAFRTALRSAKQQVRRGEVTLSNEPTIDREDAFHEVHLREMQQLLHAELSRLPSRYRDVIVLCDLLGNSRAEAAEQLDCSESSVKAALARGKRQLRLRLLRRGIALTAALGTVAVILSRSAVPAQLVDAVVAACAGSALPQGTSTIPQTAYTLASAGVKSATMFDFIFKPTVIVAIALLMILPSLAILGQTPFKASEEVLEVRPPAEDQSVEQEGTTVAIPANNQSLNTSVQDEIDRLKQARLDRLRELVRMRLELYRAGNCPLEEVIDARNRLLNAELEEGISDRKQLLARHLEAVKGLESETRTRVDNGLYRTDKLLLVESERMRIEIMLLEEKKLDQVRQNKESGFGTQ